MVHNRGKMVLRLLALSIFLHTSLYQPAAARDQGKQKVTVIAKDHTIREIFRSIKQQTGLEFFYSTIVLNQEEKINMHMVNKPLDEVLEKLLHGKGLAWTYVENIVRIGAKKDGGGSMSVDVMADADTSVTTLSINGMVASADGKPVPGATVQIKGTKLGVMTDGDGKFTLAKTGGKDVLVISSIGYETREVAVKGKSLMVQLNVDVNKLDETVVIAYGTTTQRLSTSNISTVKAKDIENQPVNNPLLALQGRVPGLFIEQANGLPGSAVTVRIQGINSLSSGSDPLYVIDGIPYVSQMLNGISSVQGHSFGNGVGTGNPMSYINPADIERIDVLKDADATAIYGSRAANGAILITTKKGKAGQTKININVQNGWSKVGHFLDLLNTQQYLQMRHEAFKNDEVSPGLGDYDINGTWDTTRYTNWQKELIAGTAQYTDAQLSVSGGSGTTSFLVGGGYHRETTVFPGDLHDQKASLHMNFNHASLNQRFHFEVDGKYLVDNNFLIANDLTSTALQLAPDAPALYNSDGSLNWAPNAAGTSTWKNPLSYLAGTYKARVNNLIGNAVLSYQLLNSLEIKTTLGYTNLQRNETSLFPLTYYAPEFRPTITRVSFFGNDLITSWIIEPQLTYKKRISKGTLETLLGSTFLKNQSNQQLLYASGFNSDLLMEDMLSAATLGAYSTLATVYRYNAIFARLNYNWQNKYIINLTGRRDGSSRFGSDNLFHDFGSVAGAWIFTNEGFVQKYLPFLSFGKLRASYGTTGNDQIGDYRFLNLYYSNAMAVPYQGVTGLTTYSLPNPHLQWEETRKLQVGLDAGFWSDRVLVNLTYYRNRSSNQLQGYQLPIITGTSSIILNYPATLQNSGWEITLNSTNIKNLNFTWSSSFNLTIPKNKLIAYKNLALSSGANTYIIGQPFTIVRLYHSLGVDPATGLFTFSDSHGSSTSTPNYPDDLTRTVNPVPTLYGGFQNSVQYRAFTVDFLFQFVKQKAAGYTLGNQPGAFYSDSYYGGAYGNQPVSVLDRWQKPGDKTSFQRFSTAYPSSISTAYYNAFNSDLQYVDASYIRLKNVSISWQLPKGLQQKAHLQNIRLFAQGQNLLTFTKYTGLDPESRSVSSLPPLRVFILGVQVTL